jgi:hypothetical protein
MVGGRRDAGQMAGAAHEVKPAGADQIAGFTH